MRREVEAGNCVPGKFQGSLNVQLSNVPQGTCCSCWLAQL
jgi:hypothetical protein